LALLSKWTAQLKRGETVEAFDDLRFAPVPVASVVDGLIDIATRQSDGIHHLSGLADISYYDIACASPKPLVWRQGRLRPPQQKSAKFVPNSCPNTARWITQPWAQITVPEPLDCFDISLRAA